VLIVAGHFDIDPADRDAFLEARSPAMTSTRSEGGCLEYVMSADPIDPARVVLFERWEDQASLDAHMAVVASTPRGGGPAPTGFSVKIYDISGERAFG
jgi:quinol monooxygenase YgiN